MSQRETLVYGLPKGETERYMEVLLATKCKTTEDIAKVKAAAAADGFHSFRVTKFDPSKPPDFVAAVTGKKRKRR